MRRKKLTEKYNYHSTRGKVPFIDFWSMIYLLIVCVFTLLFEQANIVVFGIYLICAIPFFNYQMCIRDSYDGGGHSVKNIILSSNGNASGFFGYAKDAIIENLSLDNSILMINKMCIRDMI